MNVSDKRQLARSHGLSDHEFDRAVQMLARQPTVAEVGVISAMWSEHCSYKSSKVHLGRLPSRGPRVIEGPGENAGAVDIGGGWAAVFKMESHNHPSYIEPYQGAATGVGGILRDVFTMGARPLANLNSLRFGDIDHPDTAHLFHGVVGGIAGYANCVGVPTVGGEVYFDGSYNGNILVNVFNVGVCKHDEIFRGIAGGVGNPVLYVGSATGRDGIHGATMASQEFRADEAAGRPTVQVGDPFGEKRLLEACQELMATDAIVGIQDMGAAGLTSASVEMADRAGNGLSIDADQIPAREQDMSAYEFLLSESQERMLMVVEQGRQEVVADIFERWELDWAEIGEVRAGGDFQVWRNGDKVVDIPVDRLTSAAPAYDRPRSRPAYLDELEPAAVAPAEDIGDQLGDLLASPNICSRRPIYQQYDHMVGVATVVRPGGADAAVLRVPGTDRAVAIAADCNSRFCYLDPYEGAKLAVAECARNISCVGARPLGTTDCMNFGNPENPEVMWQFSRSIDGIADACRALEAPVVSGNVSLYNASDAREIYPTPAVALVGGFDRALDAGEDAASGWTTMDFKEPGLPIVVLGQTDPADIGGSEYLWLQTGQIGDAPPALELDREVEVQRLVRRLIDQGLVRSAHDCAEGGLGVALAESCLTSGVDDIGAELDMPVGARPDLQMFCETPSRVVVTAAAGHLDQVMAAAKSAGVAAESIGRTTVHGALCWADTLDVQVSALKQRWRSGLDGLNT